MSVDLVRRAILRTSSVHLQRTAGRSVCAPAQRTGGRLLRSCCVGLAVLLVGSEAAAAQAAEPDHRLVTAARAQDTETVRSLLKEGADVNTRWPDGSTALLWATHWDQLDLADHLLRAGGDPNAANDQSVMPLILACENRSDAMVAKLLAAGANPNARQVNGVTPLMMAARTGRASIVKMLLAHGGDPNVVIASTGQTALVWATAESHLDVVRALIDAGADVHVRSTLGFTPLLFAARNGDLEAAAMLIAAGVSVNEVGADGTHALTLAIVSARDAMARFLLKHGADPNGTLAGVPALHAAAGNVSSWLMHWRRLRRQSSGAIDGFAQSERLPLVRVLLAAGADPNARIAADSLIYEIQRRYGARNPDSSGLGSAKGATALWVAVREAARQIGREVAARLGSRRNRSGTAQLTTEPAEVVQVLLDAGADPNLATADGTTPLMVAAGIGSRTQDPDGEAGLGAPAADAAMRMLVEAGVDVNAVNEANFTALHGAAFQGSKGAIRYLVEHGANINAQDFRGRTPYIVARGTQQSSYVQSWPEVWEFLTTLGADPNVGGDTNADAAAAVAAELERRRAAKREKAAASLGKP